MTSPIYNTQTVFDPKLRKTIPDEYKLPEEVTILHTLSRPIQYRQTRNDSHPSSYFLYICSNIHYPTLILIYSVAEYSSNANIDRLCRSENNIIYISSLIENDLLLMPFVTDINYWGANIYPRPNMVMGCTNSMDSQIIYSININYDTFTKSILKDGKHIIKLFNKTSGSPNSNGQFSQYCKIQKLENCLVDNNCRLMSIFCRIYKLKQKNLNSEIVQQNIKLQEEYNYIYDIHIENENENINLSIKLEDLEEKMVKLEEFIANEELKKVNVNNNIKQLYRNIKRLKKTIKNKEIIKKYQFKKNKLLNEKLKKETINQLIIYFKEITEIHLEEIHSKENELKKIKEENIEFKEENAELKELNDKLKADLRNS